jgi:pimeloyl-ACP methyl ester carboxylesterase
MPAFFIAGDRDGAAVAFDPGGEMMKSLLPDLRGMAMLPGIGHWTPQEDPEGFNRALLGFLGWLS